MTREWMVPAIGTLVAGSLGLILARTLRSASPEEPGALTTQNAPADLEQIQLTAEIDALVKEHRALGHYYDAPTGEFVIIVPSDVPMPSQEEIFEAPGPDARAERRDMTQATYDEMMKVIFKQSFHPDAKRYTYAAYLDMRTGRLALTSDAPAEVLEPLLSRYPGKIDVSFGSIGNYTGAPSRH